MTYRLKPIVFASSALAMLQGGIVHAQTASAIAATAPESGDSAQAEIVITGSRIASKDKTAESPIVTIDRKFLQAAGAATVEQTLNVLPQFAATAGASSTTPARAGRANANLRGLGIARTLVLADGRRLQPSDPNGAIDLNTIPMSLIQDVDIITGGASAVYGSDAIAGVVNFKLRKDFQGLELDAQDMVTERGDGRALDLSATFGGKFDDGRGHAMLAVSFMDRQEVQRITRPFFRDGGITPVLPSGLLPASATNLPSQAALNKVFARYGITGNVPLNATLSVNPDGTLFTSSTPSLNYRWPADGPYVVSGGAVGVPIGERYPLQQPLQRLSAYGDLSYEISDAVTAYTNFSYTHYTAEQNLYGRNQAITRDVFIPITNPFINDDIRTIMASRPNPTAPLLYYFQTGRLGKSAQTTTYNVFQITGGLRGDLGILDATWDVYGSYGRTEQSLVGGNYVDRAAFLSLVNAPDGGKSICAGGFNPFVIDPVSRECLTYLLRDIHETTTLQQINAEASLQGQLFRLPAGAVRFAAGVGYRQNRYDFSPDAARLTGSVLTAGLTSPTNGEVETKEGFLELSVPLLKDIPFIRSLGLSLAYRYSDYNTVGGVNTYKASADWTVFKGLTLRGGYQRAIRAPSVGELFAPREEGSTTVGRTVTGGGDPCDITSAFRTGANAAKVRALCIANGVPTSVVDLLRFTGTSVQASTAGNSSLKEETADTFTLGAVLRSPFSGAFRQMSLSVDYYDIKVKDAIGQITGDVIAQRCFNGQGDANPTYDPNNFYCKLIHRGAAGNFATLDTPLINLAGYRAAGIDVQFDWRLPAGEFGLPERLGALGLNVVASYLGKYEIRSLEGAPFVNYAGTIGNAQIGDAVSHPHWKTVTTFSYDNGPVSLDLRWRWIEAMDNSLNVRAANPTSKGVTSRSYFDLAGSLHLLRNVELRGGILNLADKQPPVWTGEAATDAASYDILGRRFYLGAKLKF